MLDETIRMLDRHDPADPRHNRILTVDVGDNAHMTVPCGYWLWRMTHQKDMTPPGIADDRMLAVSVFQSFRHLIMNCTKEEAWRRIKLMREAIENEPVED